MIHIPKGAKVLKGLLLHKKKLEKAASSMKLSEECSAIIQRSLPQKEGDPRSFTLPCLIGPLAVKNALSDLGAKTQQVAARDEKWVPFTERVKISSINIRLETTVPQKEEIFQVVIDLIKNSSCFKAFTISIDIPEIFMQQFWYSIKKVQGTDSYEFLLANKKCVVNADVFRTTLDICPRVEGVNFIDVPDDDTTLAFLIKLGYKGPLYKHTNMFVDHMHQPWRTLAAIINKCLSRKTASNDKLCKSRIDILWVVFYRENVDYPKLIWEDLAYQIDHKKEKRSRRKNMPFFRFTKFVRIGEDYQEYGLSIPETMLTKAIKQSESYQMFIKYSTSQIPLKKSKGKGSQRKKTADDSQETVDVSKESEPEPEPVKRKTSSKIRVKKKVTLSADDNIIFDDLDTALELGKSISKTEAEEAEAARQVYATHARIVTKYVPGLTKRRKSGKVTSDPPKKLKGVPSLTPEEQEVGDIMQALKESKKTSKRQPVISATSSEETSTKPGVPDEEKDITEENVILEWGSEQESDADDEDDETESDEDDIYKYKIRVRKDEDEEMLNAEVEDSDKGDEEITDAAKADAEKTSEVKDDPKKTKLPPASSSLSVSSGFGDQFLKLSSDTSLVSTVKDTIDVEINSLLEVKIQSEVPHTQSPSMLSVPISVIFEPTVLTPVQETFSAAPVITLPLPSVSTIPPAPQQTTTPIPPPPIITPPSLRVAKLEKDVSELKKIDLSAKSLATLKTQVPSIVDNYLGSKVGDVFQKELKKHTADLIQKYSLQQIHKLPKKQTSTVDLEQESE
ncbi:hypothetical protein Tco_0937539 [Tanacetum coccineum]|uniref:Uncharacterized protein n=1 Tax=Tanacetum coccineum TaxID=301880 RepID=A0ABQ5DLK3_9ASTR